MRRLSQNDSNIVDSVEKLKKEIAAHRAELLKDEKKSEQIVAQKAAIKSDVESQLASRQQMLAGRREADQEARAPGTPGAHRRRQGRRGGSAPPYSHPRARPAPAAAPARPPAHIPRSPPTPAVPRRALRLGRRQPVGLRLLGSGHVLLSAGGRHRPLPQRPDAVQLDAAHRHRLARQPATSCSSARRRRASTTSASTSGGGQMIHAPHTGAVVSYESIYYSDFYGGGRPVEAPQPRTTTCTRRAGPQGPPSFVRDAWGDRPRRTDDGSASARRSRRRVSSRERCTQHAALALASREPLAIEVLEQRLGVAASGAEQVAELRPA